MKRIIGILTFMLFAITTYACPECEKQQPKVLRGIAHGAGPESQWDYVIVWAIVAIVLITLFFAVKWTIKPGEKDPNHIKRTFINFN
jgi:uncharacterized protein HemY